MVPPKVIGAKASAGANCIKVKGALQIYTSRDSSAVVLKLLSW